MKLYTTSEFISSDISFEKKNNKKNLTTKIKLYTTSEFISSDISFEKINSHYKMKLYRTSEFISNDILFKKIFTTRNYFQSIHNSSVIKSV